MNRLFLSFLLGAGYLAAVQHSGSVRAADQFIPGATVTARQGGAKLVTSTDEAGRYTLDLTPGFWEMQVEIFGFKPASLKIEIGADPSSNDWTLEMPRPGDPLAAPPAAALEPAAGFNPPAPPANTAAAPPRPAPVPAAPARRTNGGRPAQPQRPGFQNLSVKATEAGAQALAATAAEPPPAEIGGGDNDSFVVSGSTSGGLAAATDEQTRRDRQPGRGAAGGQAAGGIAEMAAMSAGGGLSGDGLGLNGFGAAGVQSGFGDGFGGAANGGARDCGRRA